MFNPRKRFQASTSSYYYEPLDKGVLRRAVNPRPWSNNVVDRIAARETSGGTPMSTSASSSSSWSRSLMDSRLEHATRFYYKDLVGHFGCVNTVEFSGDGSLLASGGDCRRLLLWNVWDAVNTPNYTATEMRTQHNSNIFCISFDAAQRRLYSGGNDEMVIIHNIETGESIEQIGHMDDVYGLSVDPTNNNVFASASNEVTLWDIRSPSVKSTRLATGNQFHAVMHSPTSPHLLVSANSKEGVAVYDSRRPLHRLLHFYSSSVMSTQGAMCVRFNRKGRLILALRRKQPPVLYDLRSPYPLVEFDSADYYNSCTIKNCCFAGADESFVASGSDNFKVYLWAVPEAVMGETSEGPLRQQAMHYVPQAKQILNGHRSIVNHVRFNEHNGMLASTGVEKLVKLWSPLVRFEEAEANHGKLSRRDKRAGHIRSQDFSLETHIQRNVYTHRDYINLVHGDRGGIGHDYSSNNTAEDRRMIAYFDSMIEREVNSAAMLDSSDNESGSYYSLILPKEIDFTEHLSVCKSLEMEMDGEGEEDNSDDNDDGEDTEDEDGQKVKRRDRVRFRDSDLSMDSEATFELQKRFNFHLGVPKPKPGRGSEEDHLAYVFSKRMHARYLLSYVEGLIERVEGLESIAEKRRKKAAEEAAREEALAAGLPPPKRPPKRVSLRTSSLFMWIRPQLLLANINEQIKRKKEGELIFFSYKFAKTLLTAYHFGTLFSVREQKRLQISAKHDDSEPRLMDLNCRQRVQEQIRAMARITTSRTTATKNKRSSKRNRSSDEEEEEEVQKEEQHLHDRRLYDLLSRLYKRIIHLLNMLSDSTYDIKAKRKEFLRELHPHPIVRYRARAHAIADQSEDSEEMELAALDEEGGILLEEIGREMLAEPDDTIDGHMYPYTPRDGGGGSISEDSPSSQVTEFIDSEEEERATRRRDRIAFTRAAVGLSPISCSTSSGEEEEEEEEGEQDDDDDSSRASSSSSSSSSSSEAASSASSEEEEDPSSNSGSEAEAESEAESDEESNAESNAEEQVSSPSNPDTSPADTSSSSSSSNEEDAEDEGDNEDDDGEAEAEGEGDEAEVEASSSSSSASSPPTYSLPGPSTPASGSNSEQEETEAVFFKKSSRHNKSYKHSRGSDSSSKKRKKRKKARRRSPSPSSENDSEPAEVEEEKEEEEEEVEVEAVDEEDEQEEENTSPSTPPPPPAPPSKRKHRRKKVCKRKRQRRS